VESVAPRASSSCQNHSIASGQSYTKTYLSALTSFYGADCTDDSDNDVLPQNVWKNRPPPQLTFDFEKDLDFPGLQPPPGIPMVAQPPNQLTKLTSSSITMSEINDVHSEMQAQLDDLKRFKEKMISKVEDAIADAVKTSVTTAMLGIKAQMNEMFLANNKIIYDNMQAEHLVIP
jgi:hypothetical protein